jgi:inhibitor of KinA sporulation pathway (predicted exonuclease)
MKKPVDIINVVDVESTCWNGDPPQGQKSEIIEIGICSLVLGGSNGSPFDLLKSDSRSIMVKPQWSTVSPFCTELTTITQEMVDKGLTFLAACDVLREQYKSKDRIWASYGDYDRVQFERCCARYGASAYPFGSRHINVKTLIAVVERWDSEVGMDEALRRLKLPMVGTHHRGSDDASNIASILAYILAKGHANGKEG